MLPIIMISYPEIPRGIIHSVMGQCTHTGCSVIVLLISGADGLLGCCIVTVLASHLLSELGPSADWNQFLIIWNMMYGG